MNSNSQAGQGAGSAYIPSLDPSSPTYSRHRHGRYDRPSLLSDGAGLSSRLASLGLASSSGPAPSSGPSMANLQRPSRPYQEEPPRSPLAGAGRLEAMRREYEALASPLGLMVAYDLPPESAAGVRREIGPSLVDIHCGRHSGPHGSSTRRPQHPGTEEGASQRLGIRAAAAVSHFLDNCQPRRIYPHNVDELAWELYRGGYVEEAHEHEQEHEQQEEEETAAVSRRLPQTSPDGLVDDPSLLPWMQRGSDSTDATLR